jgi:hypothetical protein
MHLSSCPIYGVHFCANINITLRGSQVLMPRKLTNNSSADAIVGEFGDGAIAAALIGRIDW